MVEYNGKQYDSNEEVYMLWWLEEMKELGLVLNYKHHPKPLLLSDKVTVPQITIDKKGNERVKQVFIMHDHVYEYDYKVELNPAYEGMLFCTTSNYHKELPIVANRRKSGQILWAIDVKPTYEKDHGSNTRFPLNQKWVWSAHGVYVQKIIPEDLIANNKLSKAGFFYRTFCPKRYVFRPMAKRNGEFLKVKCLNVRTADEYIKSTI